MDRVNLEIRKIYANNLVVFFNNSDYYMAYYGLSHVGKVVKSEGDRDPRRQKPGGDHTDQPCRIPDRRPPWVFPGNRL